MYPHTIIDLVDQSQFAALQVPEDSAPLFLSAFTSDKGPEGWRLVNVSTFEKLYGAVSSKHGQALLQTKRSIDSGAKMLCYRAVADDATLANVILAISVKKGTTQKRDENGNLVYLTAGSVETIEATGNTPVMVDTIDQKLEALTATGATSKEDVIVSANGLYSVSSEQGGTSVYPIFALCDIGRGLSNKKFRLSPAYDKSKNLGFLLYQLDIIEGTTLMDTLYFALNGDRVYEYQNMSIEPRVKAGTVQVQAIAFEQFTEAYFNQVNKVIAGGYSTIDEFDILFGKTIGLVNKSLYRMTFNSASINLSHVYGIPLTSGTEGLTPLRPASAEYGAKLAAAFNGVNDYSIFDLDLYKIDACIDANYPAETKRAIESLANFRGDFFFFRDCGIVSTMESIKQVHAAASSTRYSASNLLAYDVIDPYSMKQITVTIGYTLSKILVSFFNDGRHRPLSGIINGAVVDDAIEGTINFIPRVTPSFNQKQELDDLRINYGGYYDGRLVIETQYTSQAYLSQFSYISNVLTTQEVIKAIRTECPKIRYNFQDGKELEQYKKDVQKVIDRYVSKFKELKFEYIEDQDAANNKIFRGAVYVKFRNYTQAEWFTVYALA